MMVLLQSRQKYLILLMLTGLAFSFFQLNQQVPRFADDFCRYSEHFNLALIVASVFQDYTSWTGRFPVMFVNHTIFSLDESGLLLFNLSSALVFILCARLALLFADSDSKDIAMSACVLCCFLFLFWFTPHRFGEAVLWKTGAIQYFWGCVAALFIVKPVITHILETDPKEVGRDQHSIIRKVGYLCLCFLAGAWLENLSVAVAIVWILLLGYGRYVQHKKWSNILLWGLTGWLLGSLILIVAPGNYARVAALGDTTSFMERIIPVSLHLYVYLNKSLLLLYLLFVLLLFTTGAEDIRKKFLTSVALILIGSLSTLSMVAAPDASFVSRAVFPFEFFLIFATLSIFPGHIFKQRTRFPYQRMGLITLSTLFFIAVSVNFSLIYLMYQGVSQQEQYRQLIIKEHTNLGITHEVPLPALFFGDLHNTINGQVNVGRFFARDITDESTHWRNSCYSKAHQIGSVKLDHQYQRDVQR